LRKKGTTQNYVFLKHVPQLTTGNAPCYAWVYK